MLTCAQHKAGRLSDSPLRWMFACSSCDARDTSCRPEGEGTQQTAKAAATAGSAAVRTPPKPPLTSGVATDRPAAAVGAEPPASAHAGAAAPAATSAHAAPAAAAAAGAPASPGVPATAAEGPFAQGGAGAAAWAGSVPASDYGASIGRPGAVAPEDDDYDVE